MQGRAKFKEQEDNSYQNCSIQDYATYPSGLYSAGEPREGSSGPDEGGLDRVVSAGVEGTDNEATISH